MKHKNNKRSVKKKKKRSKVIWITGDIHGDPTRFITENFPEQKEMTREDYVVICGDFGLVWDKQESKTEKHWLDWLEDKPFTTLFIDGNHENFDRLDCNSVKAWGGGFVNEIRPHVLRLRRGEVFVIADNKFFTFGGASSHDIRDGILDPGDFKTEEEFRRTWKQWDKERKLFRVKGYSWWPQELPSEEEMHNGIRNLEKHNWKVDYIITHSPSASVIALLGHGLYEQDVLTRYLEEIRCKTEYKRMISGHIHVDKQVNDKDILLYEQIIRIA